MSDDRPRPAYGEYATPEEVAAITGRPVVPRSAPTASPKPLTTPPSGAPPLTTRKPRRASAEHPGPRLPPPDPAELRHAPPPLAADRVKTVPAWDRRVTISLLVVGLLHLMISTPGYLAFDQAVRQGFGIGELQDPSAVRSVGIAALVIHAVALGGATAWSLRRLTAGLRAFWVPLIGAAVTNIVPGILVAVVLVGDPAFVALVSGG